MDLDELLGAGYLPLKGKASDLTPLRPLDGEDEIRLLLLAPGSITEPLSCTICHERLAKKPDYQALSYVWGPQDSGHSIWLDGSQISIGRNLHDALVHLRALKTYALWIDRICINQEDLAERSQQVSLMASIYFKASRVRIWLGDSCEDTRQAYSVLETIFEYFITRSNSDITDLSNLIRQELSGGRTLSKAYNLPDAESEEWMCVTKLMDRQWFKRAWTFQEILAASAADIHCGLFSMPWDKFSKSLMVIKYIQLHYTGRRRGPFFSIKTDVPLQMMTTKANLSTMKAKHKVDLAMDLARLLEVRRIAASTDPRDRVFSLLNVASDRFNAATQICYTWEGCGYKKWNSGRSNYELTTKELYTLVARHTTALDESLGILLNIECPKYDDDLPSWVPDWRANLVEPFRRPDLTGQKRPYSATGRAKIQVQDQECRVESGSNHIYLSNPGTLVLRGLYIDTIVTVASGLGSRDFGDFRSIISINKEWKSLADSIAVNSKYAPTEEDISQAYTRTRLGDIWPGQERWNPSVKLPDSKTFGYKASPGNLANRSFTRVMEHGSHRRFFTTKLGYMGVGPSTTKEGDKIYLLLGGIVPFILRCKSPDSLATLASGPPTSSKPRMVTTTFTFVGESYVHGLMDGEGLLKARPEQRRSNDVSKNYKWLFSLKKRDPDVECLQWVILE